MKDFLKYTLATVTGLIIAGVIFTIISISAIVGMIASLSPSTPSALQDNSILHIKLKGEMTELLQEDPLSMFLEEEFPNISLQQITSAIETAKNSPEIKGIYIEAGALAASPAALQEIRNALTDFKESGKFIAAYADNYTQGTYYLCSVADHVMLNPQGNIAWTGMNAETMFYKDLLDKLGIEMQIFKVGTYKSAVEPFTTTQMSEANREQTKAYLQSIWTQIVNGISESRNIPADSLNAYANNLLAYASPETFTANNMVDTLIYRNDAILYVNNLYNSKQQIFKPVTPSEIAAINSLEIPKSLPTIAVYYAEGGIDDSESDLEFGIHAPLVCKDLRSLAEDDNVKAVVLRVNSPGGSAYGSEQIWHEIMNLKAHKPVIVSMGGYAASGGYYISCAANSIIAEPTTITGSIGIFGMIPNIQGLTNKIGIHVDGVSTNQHAGGASLFRPLDAPNKAAMQQMIERGYALFVKRCAEGRKMSEQDIRNIAEGRVWTGEMAVKNGLVDSLGDLNTAIDIAAQKAGLDNYDISNYPIPEDLFTKILNGKFSSFAESHIRSFLGQDYESLRFFKRIQQQAPVQARVPYDIQFNL